MLVAKALDARALFGDPVNLSVVLEGRYIVIEAPHNLRK